MPDLFDSYSTQRPDINPIIYVYEESYLPGYLKVGYTTKPVNERMDSIHPLNMPIKTWNVLYTESALYPEGGSFMDHEVHRKLKDKGFLPARDAKNEVDTEFFQCSLDDVKAAIKAVKYHEDNVENRTQDFGMRPEQEEAVNKTKAYFEEEKTLNPVNPPKFLWNCKMRFGKTFTAYELAKKMGMKKVLILTFKPAVEDSWETDLMSHIDFEGWQFYSKKEEHKNHVSPEDLDQTKPIVCFGSFQDFLGTNENGGIKVKNEWVHATHWDMVIFDEYHYGAWRENAKKLFGKEDEEEAADFDAEKYKKDEADNAINESFIEITTDYYLFLSGTPFRAINTGEFLEDQIYSWTYSDEQEAKEKWYKDYPNKPNPYASLPRMIMMTYKLPEEIENVAKAGEYDEFNLNIFFKAESDTDDIKDSQFKYKSDVQKWLDMIRGAYTPMSVDDLHRNSGDRPVMPFYDVRMKSILLHTLWFLPDVASCWAMKNLLNENANNFYHDYKVIVCAGTSAGVGLEAVKPVRREMNPALETKTITLTCGKLTTGVTVKPWTGIFMLRNLSTPETYFQSAFRVQSPWTMKDENDNDVIIKEDCYVFDFAVNRALRQISDYSCKLNIKEPNPEKKVADFIKFLPVLAFDGSAMKPIDAGEILDIVTAGTSASLLARRWESALLVNVDNGTLTKILNSPEALKALESIEGFRSLNKDIATIINKSEHVKNAKSTDTPLTPKQQKTVSEEEKEIKSKRKQIQEKLIKFATRIPIFMYLTDFREYSLKDVITRLEPGLFKKVTGLEIKDFELLVNLNVFNAAVMNDAIYKFKRYEDSSLEYTGISKQKPDANVGLYDTTITQEEYEQLAAEQHGSIEQPDFSEENVTQPSAKDSAEIIIDINQPMPSKPIVNTKKAIKNVKEGTVVFHDSFGEGVVIQKDKEYVTVRFTIIGTKKFKNPEVFKKGTLRIVKEVA